MLLPRDSVWAANRLLMNCSCSGAMFFVREEAMNQSWISHLISSAFKGSEDLR